MSHLFSDHAPGQGWQIWGKQNAHELQFPSASALAMLAGVDGNSDPWTSVVPPVHFSIPRTLHFLNNAL